MAGAVPLVVTPGPPLAGAFKPPGDKSVTHRAILFGLLAAGTTRISNANPGADCARSLACAETLGARVARDGDTLLVEGVAGRVVEPAEVLDCGNSGTTLRLLAGLLAAQPVLAVLTGDASLRNRPVARVVEPLRAMGATLAARDGDRLPPLVVRGGALRPLAIERTTPSAQVATAVLLAGLQTAGRTSVAVAAGARDHTARMLPAFGVPIASAEGQDAVRLAVEGPLVPRATRLEVPGDPSAAAFFLAAAAASPGARVTARGVSLNPTRCGLLDALEAMGARVERRALGVEAGEPVGDVTVEGPARLRAADVAPAAVPAMIDEFPAWCVAAAAAEGVSRIAGAGELRVKESDRLAAMARALAALGVAVEERADGLAIAGGAVRGGRVAAHGDHRVAMSLAVLATRAAGPVAIDDASSIATSYPGFTADLAALGGRVVEASA
uniref:3-phosphoshikimate 1-carboxyvinyltransferase n=1 Tax=Eiseniibacteriota bacterium TaxID=2212470 RepID=A0A832I1N6_UNCEI